MTTRRLVADFILTMDGSTELIAGGAVDIDRDGRIVAVGPEADLAPFDGTTDRIGGLLMPGLVNAHAHTPMTLLRSAGDGLPLQAWLQDVVWPREGRLTAEDVGAGMALGSAEMLLAGVTTSCEMYFQDDAMVDAVRSTGGRLVMTPGVLSFMCPDGDPGPRIAELTAVHAAHHDPAGRVTVGFAPHSIYDLTPEQVAAVAAQARALDTFVHMHLEETETERRLIIEKNGATATQLLADHGVLEGRLLAAHGVWLSDEDRSILGAANAAVAHCPTSNLKLGSGIAAVTAMENDGITVALGTDGPASNDSLNLWEAVKLAPLLARGANHDPSLIPAAAALDMATRRAGEAVGLDNVGRLAPGTWADLVRVDLDHPAFVPGLEDDLLTNLVFASGASAVTDVWVAGNPVVTDRTLVRVDLDELVADARARGRRLTA